MRILAIIGLLALNGFFVAVEFALVRSRRTRLEAMTRTGDRKARLALRATNNLGRVLSASQLGITLASLGLGWVAEATIGDSIARWFTTAQLPFPVEAGLKATLAATIALVIVTYCHVVFGELAPRAAALNHPEAFARWLAPLLLGFAWLVKPFIWLLNHSARLVLRMFGQRGDIEEEAVHSPDELRMLVEQSQERGALEQQDAALIEGVFEFSEKNARDVMTPRTEIVAVAIDASLEDTLATVEDSGFSRFPVYEDTIDNIVGLVLAKDLLPVLHRPPATFSLRSIARP
ncbi:MAG: hemolysin family protein, partial [Gemmatimonadaceae bacterium]